MNKLTPEKIFFRNYLSKIIPRKTSQRVTTYPKPITKTQSPQLVKLGTIQKIRKTKERTEESNKMTKIIENKSNHQELESQIENFEIMLINLEMSLPQKQYEKIENLIREFFKEGKKRNLNDKNTSLSFKSMLSKKIESKYSIEGFESLLSQLDFDVFIRNLSLNEFNQLMICFKNNRGNLRDLDQISSNMDSSVFDLYHSECLRLAKPYKRNSSNWLYLYGLPYKFDFDEFRSKIEESFPDASSIDSIVFFPYEHYIEHRAPIQNNHSGVSKQDNLTLLMNQFTDLDESLIEGIRMDELPETNNSSKNTSNNSKKDKIMDYVKKMEMTKYEKSYCMIKLKSQDDLRKLTNPYLCLFGLQIDNKCYRVDSAENKRSIILRNFPQNTRLEVLIKFINSQLKKAEIEEFEVPKGLESSLVNDNKLILTFSNFEESMKAISCISSEKFIGRRLCLMHLPASQTLSIGNVEKLCKEEIHSINEEILKEKQREILLSQSIN